jgi:surfactin synthase thioesterase subunit
MVPSFNLFCLPHAGGNKYAYKPFVDAAPAFIKVIPLDYPGRGEKVGAESLRDIQALARHLVDEIRDQLHKPYAFYGHSMGTVVGYLMACEIRRSAYRMPEFLFFTGSEGPATRKHEQQRHLLPRAALIEELRALGGISEEVFNEPEIMDFFLPVIRADFEALETYRHRPGEYLDIPISVVIGTEDKVSIEEARSWQLETRRPIEVMQLQGNHFFVFEHTARIMKMITEKVK